MTIVTRHGSPLFPTVSGSISPFTRDEMDAAVQALQSHKDEWTTRTVRERIALLDRLIQDFAAIAPRWVAACLQAKSVAEDAPTASEEWAVGPWPVLKNLRQLRQSLSDIETYGHPRIPGPVTTRPGGQVVAQVFPQTNYDRLFFYGVTAEVWMEPGITVEDLPQTQATAYQTQQYGGKVALVLGAGNVSSIGPMDILYKLFVEDQVVLFKTNPVNAYLCNHPGIDEIHITGSDKTFDAIVFGPSPEGAARKAEHKPLLTRRLTGELGNVSPVIVVPGPWSASDIAYQSEHL